MREKIKLKKVAKKSSHEESEIYLYTMKSPIIQTFSCQGKVTAVCFNSASSVLAGVSNRGKIYLWPLDSQNPRKSVKEIHRAIENEKEELKEEKELIYPQWGEAIAFAKKDTHLLISHKNTIEVWDLNTERMKKSIEISNCDTILSISEDAHLVLIEQLDPNKAALLINALKQPEVLWVSDSNSSSSSQDIQIVPFISAGGNFFGVKNTRWDHSYGKDMVTEDDTWESPHQKQRHLHDFLRDNSSITLYDISQLKQCKELIKGLNIGKTLALKYILSDKKKEMPPYLVSYWQGQEEELEKFLNFLNTKEK